MFSGIDGNVRDDGLTRAQGPRFSMARNNLYVAKISDRVSTRELESLFGKYGPIRDIHIKSDFGFVLFEDDRDAADAVRALDGYSLDGQRLIVEYQRGRGPRGGRDRERSRSRSRSRDRGGRGSSRDRDRAPGRCYNCGKDGHWARDCKDGDWTNRCYKCSGKGHIERDCPGAGGDKGSSGSSDKRRSSRSRSRSRSRSPRARSASPAPRARSKSPRDA